MAPIITLERPDSAAATLLITELEAELARDYPVESRHGFSVDQLQAVGIRLFVVRENATPAACGGLHLVDTTYAELKRIYVRPQFRGLGLGKLLLKHLADDARAHGIHLLRLETGIHQAAAIRLYEQLGFYRIPRFGPYGPDPLSCFYEQRLM